MIWNSRNQRHTGLRRGHQQFFSPLKFLLEILTHYETPKVVRFESKWIASLSLLVKCSLAISCVYLMCQRNSYQIFDRSPISAVTIEVKQATSCSLNYSFPLYNCTQSESDVNDFIVPAIENSAVTIITRITEIHHVLRLCKPGESNSTEHRCNHQAHCILPPYYRSQTDNLSRSLCWIKSPTTSEKKNYRALDYILFIRNFVEFPLLAVVRNNTGLDFINKSYHDSCEHDPIKDPLCPRFRLLKILQTINTNPDEYERMLSYGSLIEIKISWKCDLDHRLKHCQPQYQFHRRDFEPYDDNPYERGSNFLTSRHFFGPNDSELHRVHTSIYNLHIVVSVTGEVGRFDLFQTTTSIGSFLGIVSMGTIVCDLIAAFFTNFKSVKYDAHR